MPKLRETARQDMLQESADELERIDSHLSPAVRAAPAIREGHLALLTRHDPSVADGDAKDVRGEVLQGGLAVSNRLASASVRLCFWFFVEFEGRSWPPLGRVDLGGCPPRVG